jgi:phenylacetate-CoA ligase
MDGTLLFSGDSGVPLIRYHIQDTGGIIASAQMLTFLKQQGFDPVAKLQGGRGVRSLPFVYVFGRSQFTVSYFGANIYPENIMVGLEQPQVCDWVTGKFVMQVQTDADQNAVLTIAVELAPGETGDERKGDAIAHSILEHLLRLNSEFAHYVPAADQLPQIQLLPTGDPNNFPVGVKHRYSR